jgi:hypothetical protein
MVADPKKRIIVDGIEFGQVFGFWRILRSVPAALQPPRLIIGLLMVVALITVGRIWDHFSEPTIHPEGLIAGRVLSEADLARRQEILANAIKAYVDENDWPARDDEGRFTQQLSVRWVVSRIQSSYRYDREQTREKIGQKEVDRRDAEYRRTIAEIEQLRPMGPFEATARDVSRSVVQILSGALYMNPAREMPAAGTETELEGLLREARAMANPTPQGPQAVWMGLGDLFVHLPVGLWRQEKTFTFVYGIFFLLVMALGGGALSRMAACEFAGQQRLSIREAVDFAFGNWSKLVMSLLMPLGVAVIVAAILLLGGLLMAPWLDVVGGLLYGLALILGFALALLLIGYAAGLHMLVPAVACENCDAADALQRSYAYVLTRPLHLLGYVVVALVGLVLGFLVVSFFASTMLNFTAALAGVLTDNSALTGAGGFALFDLAQQDIGAIHETWHNRWAAWLVTFWQTVVIDLVAAFVIAYYFAASTIVYLLMRRTCDGQDVEEIWRPGLTPGTLAPVAGAVAGQAEHRTGGVAEAALSGAMRAATAARYGERGGQSDGDEGEAPPDDAEASAPDGKAKKDNKERKNSSKSRKNKKGDADKD